MRIQTISFISSVVTSLVLSTACSGTDGTPLDPAKNTANDGSRAPADGSRPGADPSPSSSSSSSSGQPAPNTDPKGSGGPFFRAAADKGKLATFTLDDAVVGSDGAIRVADGKGHDGSDPQPTGYHGGSFYNGGTYRYAVATSPEYVATAPFDTIIPSFEASTPPGTWIHVKVAARNAADGTWTKDYSLGVWAEDDGTVRRHSVEGEDDASGTVATDTLDLKKPANAFRITTILFAPRSTTTTPTLRAVSAIATVKSTAGGGPPQPGIATGVAKNLAVPKRSQMIYPGGGEVWCSPTSTSMLLAYWADTLSANGLRETPPEAATKCNDHVYQGTGNWPFNTAHASSIDSGRMHGAITRLSSFTQVEQLIAADIPVAISISYGKNELGKSPISSTAGHLIVVRGFAANGDVICNDPAFGSDATVEVTYNRAELTNAWRHSLGTTYLVWPATKDLPIDPSGAF